MNSANDAQLVKAPSFAADHAYTNRGLEAMAALSRACTRHVSIHAAAEQASPPPSPPARSLFLSRKHGQSTPFGGFGQVMRDRVVTGPRMYRRVFGSLQLTMLMQFANARRSMTATPRGMVADRISGLQNATTSSEVRTSAGNASSRPPHREVADEDEATHPSNPSVSSEAYSTLAGLQKHPQAPCRSALECSDVINVGVASRSAQKICWCWCWF